MTNNATMLPNDSILIIATDAVEHLLTCNELFHFVVVALNEALDPFRVVGKCVILVLDALGDAGSEAGSIFLLIHEKGLANQIRGVKDRHVALIGLPSLLSSITGCI
jgi:hypothetical protein